MRHAIKLGVIVVAAFVVAMSGLALAQDGPDPTVPGEAIRQDRAQAILNQLTPLVEQGVISQDQAEAVAEHLNGLFADREAKRQERFQRRRAGQQEILDLLSATVEDIRAAAAEGKSLADVAAEQGVDPQDIIDLKLSQLSEHLAEAVDAGRLTQEEADEKLVTAAEKISEAIHKPLNEHRPHRPFRRGAAGSSGEASPSGASVLPPNATI